LLSRLIPDRFILILLATIALASLLPVQGTQVAAAGIAQSAAVFVVFLLHGIRLPRHEVVAGVANWRIQGSLFLFIFAVMPLTGLALAKITDGWLPPLVAIGLLYCGVLPTTVQSATTYTSLAHGNVATSVVASAFNNLAAIVVTPMLFAVLAGQSGGVALSWGLAGRIALILLLPFLIGQSIQKWARPFVIKHPAGVKWVDQIAIAIAVYVAFSAAVVDGIWQRVSGGDFAILGAALTAMLAVAFGGAWALGGWLRLARADRVAVLFAGAHKSIAVGAPLAALLFPAGAAGMVLLPILIYHLVQLLFSAWLAPLLAPQDEG
jgi:sodium/bile acid cotransporter 7